MTFNVIFSTLFFWSEMWILVDNRILSVHELQWGIETKYPFGDITSFQWHSFCERNDQYSIDSVWIGLSRRITVAFQSTRLECPALPVSFFYFFFSFIFIFIFYFYFLSLFLFSVLAYTFLRQRTGKKNPEAIRVCHVHIFQFHQVNAFPRYCIVVSRSL